jgi:hypothetical protein
MTTKVETKTKITVTCDGPSCAARQNTPTPITIVWTDEELRADPEALPDGLKPFIKAQFGALSTNKPLEFCSKDCLLDYVATIYEDEEPKQSISQADGEAA